MGMLTQLRNPANRVPALFRGKVPAAAMLIDEPGLGEHEARARVLSLLEPETEIRRFTDNRLLMLFGSARSMRAEGSLGELLCLRDGILTNSPTVMDLVATRPHALASILATSATDVALPWVTTQVHTTETAGVAASTTLPSNQPVAVTIPSWVRVVLHGEWIEVALAELPRIDPASWLDLSNVDLLVLEPTAQPALVTKTLNAPLPAPKVDVRAKAGVGSASKQTQKLRAHSDRKASRVKRRSTSGGIRTFGDVFRSLSSSEVSAQTGFGRALQRLWQRLGASYQSADHSVAQKRGGSNATGAVGSPRPKRLRSLFANLVIKSPAAILLARRHRKYLEALQEQFTKGYWEEALRNAISVAKAESLGATLRLPSRRDSLAISKGGNTATTSVPWGQPVQMMLREQYLNAAQRLEREDKIDQAAFVYFDLLGDNMEGIALLERHQRWQLAAEIAEGHKLDPELQIALWWKAGHRERATTTARRTGAFGPAVMRAGKSDPALAKELRREWVRSLLQSDSLLLAVEAGWPDPELHASLAEPIASGMTLGGPDKDTLRAYQFATDPTESHLGGVLAQLHANDARASVEDTPGAQERLILALAKLEVLDPAADRQVATQAVRALLATSAEQELHQGLRDALRTLSRRSDPVLLADLPSGVNGKPRPQPQATDPNQPTQQQTSILCQPTTLLIADAVTLPDGGLILALGESGLRQVNSRGVTVAAWPIPAHKIILADHGNRLLALTRRGTATEVHILSLATRKIRHWHTIEAHRWSHTFDGALWWVVDSHGLALLDTEADRPTAIWRELEGERAIVDLQRSPTSLAAVVLHDTPGNERWVWTLPGVTLRERTKYETGLITATAGLIQLVATETGCTVLSPSGKPCAYPWESENVGIFVSGMSFAVHCHDDQAHTVDVSLGVAERSESVTLTHHRAGTSVGFSAAGNHATMWSAGEVLSFSIERRTPPNRFRFNE
jgi:hypothetical protein